MQMLVVGILFQCNCEQAVNEVQASIGLMLHKVLSYMNF